MSAPSLPTGYDVAKHVSVGRPDCHVTVGFDRVRSHIPRFLVQLHYLTSTDAVEWTAIARIDHNVTSTQGHDVYQEGLHIDIDRRTSQEVQLDLAPPPLPQSRGMLIRNCVQYLQCEMDYVFNVYEERHPPGSPPRWSPDGGEPTRTFISSNPLDDCMSREAPTEDEVISLEELTELLAEVEGTTPEKIRRGAEEFEIAPPEEATVVGYGDRDSRTAVDDE